MMLIEHAEYEHVATDSSQPVYVQPCGVVSVSDSDLVHAIFDGGSQSFI